MRIDREAGTMPLGSLLPTGARGIVISLILLVRSYAVRANRTFMQLPSSP